MSNKEILQQEIDSNQDLTKKQDIAPLERDKADESFYGKFKTKESLINSYNQLEQELTKKSTKLKEIEKSIEERENSHKIDKKIRDFLEEYPAANDYLAEIEKEFTNNQSLVAEENGLEKALLKVLCEKKKGAEVGKSEEKNITDTKTPYNPSLSLRGELPSYLPTKPKTLRDAQRLAVELISKNHK